MPPPDESGWLLRRGKPVVEAAKAQRDASNLQSSSEFVAAELLRTKLAHKVNIQKSHTTTIDSDTAKHPTLGVRPALRSRRKRTPPLPHRHTEDAPFRRRSPRPKKRRSELSGRFEHALLNNILQAQRSDAPSGSVSPLWKLQSPNVYRSGPRIDEWWTAGGRRRGAFANQRRFARQVQLALDALRCLLPPAGEATPLDAMSEGTAARLRQHRVGLEDSLLEEWGYLSRRTALERELFHVKQRHILLLESGTTNPGAPRWVLETRSVKTASSNRQHYREDPFGSGQDTKLKWADDGAHLPQLADGPNKGGKPSPPTTADALLNKQLLGHRKDAEMDTTLGRGWEGLLVRELTDTVRSEGSVAKGKEATHIPPADVVGLVSMPGVAATRWVDAAFKRVVKAGQVEPMLQRRCAHLEEEIRLLDYAFARDRMPTSNAADTPARHMVASRLLALVGHRFVAAMLERHSEYELAWDVITSCSTPMSNLSERAVLELTSTTQHDASIRTPHWVDSSASVSIAQARPPNELALLHSSSGNTTALPPLFQFRSLLHTSSCDTNSTTAEGVVAAQLACVGGVWWAAHGLVPLLVSAFDAAKAALDGLLAYIGQPQRVEVTSPLIRFAKVTLYGLESAKALERMVVGASRALAALEVAFPAGDLVATFPAETTGELLSTPVAAVYDRAVTTLRMLIRAAVTGKGEDATCLPSELPTAPSGGLLPQLLRAVSVSLAQLHQQSIVVPPNASHRGVLGAALVPLVRPSKQERTQPVAMHTATTSNIPKFAWRCLRWHEDVINMAARCGGSSRSCRGPFAVSTKMIQVNAAGDSNPATQAARWIKEFCAWVGSSYSNLFGLMIEKRYPHDGAASGAENDEVESHHLEGSFLTCGDGAGVPADKWSDAVQDRHNAIVGMWMHLKEAATQSVESPVSETDLRHLSEDISTMVSLLYRIGRALPITLPPGVGLEANSANPYVRRWLREAAAPLCSPASEHPYHLPWERFNVDCRRRLATYGQALLIQIHALGGELLQEQHHVDGASSSLPLHQLRVHPTDLLRRRRYQLVTLLEGRANKIHGSGQPGAGFHIEAPAMTAAVQSINGLMAVVLGSFHSIPSTTSNSDETRAALTATISWFYMQIARRCGRGDWARAVALEVCAMYADFKQADAVPAWLLVEPVLLDVDDVGWIGQLEPQLQFSFDEGAGTLSMGVGRSHTLVALSSITTALMSRAEKSELPSLASTKTAPETQSLLDEAVALDQASPSFPVLGSLTAAARYLHATQPTTGRYSQLMLVQHAAHDALRAIGRPSSPCGIGLSRALRVWALWWYLRGSAARYGHDLTRIQIKHLEVDFVQCMLSRPSAPQSSTERPKGRGRRLIANKGGSIAVSSDAGP